MKLKYLETQKRLYLILPIIMANDNFADLFFYD